MKNLPTARWRLLGLSALALVLYLVLHWSVTALSARHGFGSPDGLGLGFATLAVLAVAARALLLTVVPAVLAYRMITWVLMRILPGPR
ncbi:hypothetical protein ACFO5K_02195 [Nocardia halotolerans]|uniref:Uncharacterized protein n=1 Tax=Nocardia halotolerans TaxID=1755878 RepID=A0ABV8VAK7_9NOCA